jgi:hypothetical protein
MRAGRLLAGIGGLLIGASLAAAAFAWTAFAPESPIRIARRGVPEISRADLDRLSSEDLASRLFTRLEQPFEPVVADSRRDAALVAHGGGELRFFHRAEPVGAGICAVLVDTVQLDETFVVPFGRRFEAGDRGKSLLFVDVGQPSGRDDGPAAVSLARRCGAQRDFSHAFSATEPATALRATAVIRQVQDQARRGVLEVAPSCRHDDGDGRGAKPCDGAAVLGGLKLEQMTDAFGEIDGAGFRDRITVVEPSNGFPIPYTDVTVRSVADDRPKKRGAFRIQSIEISQDSID